MAGHAAPRIIQTAAGMLNAIGLQNIGVDELHREKAAAAAAAIPRCKVIVNVFGYTVGEYMQVIERLNDAEGIAAYELNVSCPNVHAGGMAFGSDSGSLEYLVHEVAQGSRQASADRQALAQRHLHRAHGPYLRRLPAQTPSASSTPSSPCPSTSKPASPRLTNITGGLSGPAIKPIALRMVYEAARAVNIPIIGMGGIVTPEDAVEFLLAGATAVQVGTASYADPRATERLAKGLESWCRSHHVERVASLTGAIDLPQK